MKLHNKFLLLCEDQPYISGLINYLKFDAGIKVYNSLPQSIRNLSNDTKQFKSELKNYLHAHSFYFIDEYLNVNR
jgi:hypothetical protein